QTSDATLVSVANDEGAAVPRRQPHPLRRSETGPGRRETFWPGFVRRNRGPVTPAAAVAGMGFSPGEGEATGPDRRPAGRPAVRVPPGRSGGPRQTSADRSAARPRRAPGAGRGPGGWAASGVRPP